MQSKKTETAPIFAIHICYDRFLNPTFTAFAYHFVLIRTTCNGQTWAAGGRTGLGHKLFVVRTCRGGWRARGVM